jgi:hypothetical protein
MTVSWFEPQNQAGFGLLVAPQNRWEFEDGVGHASRYRGLVHVEASQSRVFSLALRMAEAQRWVVHMALLPRPREDQVEDGWVNAMGCIRRFYPNFSVFYVLGTRGILVF